MNETNELETIDQYKDQNTIVSPWRRPTATYIWGEGETNKLCSLEISLPNIQRSHAYSTGVLGEFVDLRSFCETPRNVLVVCEIANESPPTK